jgi:GMP synthase-like glutamine amidotransferase
MVKVLLILNSKKFTTYSYFVTKDYDILYSVNIENKSKKYISDLVSNYDLIVIGGGTQHLTKNEIENYKEIMFLTEIIKACDEQNKLMIGICLGCQLIAHVYECEIKKLEHTQIGYNYLDTNSLNNEEIENDKFLSNIDYNKLQGAFSFHNDYIDINEENKQLIIIGKSINDLPYIIKHKNKPIYGFQQHPEHTQQTLGRIIKIFKVDENHETLDDEININFFDSFVGNL